jgi:hypothetical protein
LDHVDTDEKLFLLMQESYPSSYNDYGFINPFEKLAISILKTGIVPEIDNRQRNQYYRVITRINNYLSQNDVPVIPDCLLQIEEAPVLKPAYSPSYSGDEEMTIYLEGIRLMGVEVEVIKMIRTGVIPNMSEEKKSKLMTDLEEINDIRVEGPHPALDISKSLYDHFPEEDFFPVEEEEARSVEEDEINSPIRGAEYEFRQMELRREEAKANGYNSNDSSVFSPYESDQDTDDELFGDEGASSDPFYRGSMANRSYQRAMARRHE